MEPDDGPEYSDQSPKAAGMTMQQVQALVRRYVPEGVSLIDDLLQERRREVAEEMRGRSGEG